MAPWTRTLTLLAAALLLTSCSTDNLSGGGDDDKDGPIRIGAVLDITGVGADLGVAEQNALKLLAEQLNEDGGIDGREVELTIVDNQSTEDGAAKAAATLLEDERVHVILGASRTGPSLAMKAVVESAEVPMISLAANSAVVADSEWVFKTPQNDVLSIERILQDASEKGYASIDLVRDASGFGEGVPEAITELGEQYGVTLGVSESYEPTATDFTAQLTAVRASDADAVLIWGINPAAALAQKAYAQLGVDKPVYQSYGVASPAFVEAAGDAAEGVVVPSGRMLVAGELDPSDPQTEVITAFQEAYQAEYGAPASSFAGYAHDAFEIAVQALDEAGTDPDQLRDAIEGTTDLVGVTGVYSMSPDDHAGLDVDSLVLTRVEGGEFRLVRD